MLENLNSITFFRKPTSHYSLNLKGSSKTSPSFLTVKSFSKIHQSSLTLKGGSTSHLGLLPSGKKRKPPYSVLKPLRYKVGGPSEVCASFLCGMNRMDMGLLMAC